jgi:hypothetical protein
MDRIEKLESDMHEIRGSM